MLLLFFNCLDLREGFECSNQRMDELTETMPLSVIKKMIHSHKIQALGNKNYLVQNVCNALKSQLTEVTTKLDL